MDHAAAPLLSFITFTMYHTIGDAFTYYPMVGVWSDTFLIHVTARSRSYKCFCVRHSVCSDHVLEWRVVGCGQCVQHAVWVGKTRTQLCHGRNRFEKK